MKKIVKGSGLLIALVLGACVTSIFAESGDLASIADTVTSNFESFGKLIVAAAYLAGFGMVITGIFKFKQHKDNPQQIPMSTPLTILLVGAALIFMPSIIEPIGVSVFGTSPTQGGFQGEGATSIGGV